MRKEKFTELNNHIEKLKTKNKEFLDNDNKFLKIERYKCNIDDRYIIREKLVKGKNDGSAITIIPVLENGEILTVIEPRVFTKSTVGVGFPAGYIDDDENEEDAALRELMEETGHSAKKVIMLDSYYQDEGCSSALNKIFVALGCTKVTEQKLDEDEIVEYMTLTFDEIEELETLGYIMGGHTKLAINKYRDFLNKE